MNARRILFVDRDGTLNEEPADEQVDALEKLRLLPGVIPALLAFRRAGYGLVMVTNQDGLGTPRFPSERFTQVQNFLIELFASQGILFEAICVCPHFAHEHCHCKKPKIGMLDEFLRTTEIDKAHSFMIGDRDTDMQFAANLAIPGVRISQHGGAEQSWAAVAARLLEPARRATLTRKTKETEVVVAVDLGREGPSRICTGIGFFDHMLEQIARHGGFALELTCSGDLHVDEHHTVEDSALALGAALREALGDKRGIGRYGFVLAMDEAQAQIALDLSGRAYFEWQGRLNRERVGELPTELVPHFFRSLADALGAALHVSVRGENTHHMIESCFKGVGRSLRQAIRREGSELPSTKGQL